MEISFLPTTLSPPRKETEFVSRSECMTPTDILTPVKSHEKSNPF